MNVATTLRWGVRLLGAVMLLLGLAIWTGSADGLIPIHMLVGIVFVVCLLGLAYVAWRAGVPAGLPIVAVVLAIVLPVLGVTQEHLLEGDLHLVVQIVHLALGAASIGVGEAMAARAARPEARAAS